VRWSNLGVVVVKVSWRVAVWLAATATLVVGVPGSGSAAVDPSRPTFLLGAYAGTGTDEQSAVQDLQSTLGRPLAGVRVYDLWDEPFPSSYDLWLRDTGHAEFLSVKAKRTNGSTVLWRSIADAQPGSALYADLVGWANDVKSYGSHIYFTFNHEPEAAASDANGTPQDFIDAWRKVITVFRNQGVTNATYVFIVTSYAFKVNDGRNVNLWYPGDAYVDAVGSDAYNWYTCRTAAKNPWRSLEEIIAPQRTWGASHPTKPLMLTEWASTEDPNSPGRKAQWIDAARALFEQPGWEQFTTVLYYDNSQKANCDFWLDSSPSTTTAITQMANDVFYTRYETTSSDTSPPSVPGTPSGLSNDPGTIDLTWLASADDVAGSITYHVFRDGGASAVGTVTSSSTGTVSFRDTGLAGGSTHTYRVSASDGVNESAKSAASAPITVRGPTAIFADAFDAGFANWTSVTGMTVDQTLGAPAPPSARAQTSASRAWASKTLPATFGSACVSARVNLTSTTDGGALLRFRTASDGPIVRLYLTSSRGLSIRSDVSGASAATGVTIPTGSWSTLELCGSVGSSGTWTVYRNGAAVFGPWAANTGTTPIGRVVIGTPDARTITVNLDDVVVDTAPGP
jgi:Glycosyl hydrolase family 26